MLAGVAAAMPHRHGSGAAQALGRADTGLQEQRSACTARRWRGWVRTAGVTQRRHGSGAGELLDLGVPHVVEGGEGDSYPISMCSGVQCLWRGQGGGGGGGDAVATSHSGIRLVKSNLVANLQQGEDTEKSQPCLCSSANSSTLSVKHHFLCLLALKVQ